MLQKLPSVWGKHQDTDQVCVSGKKKNLNCCTNQANQSFLIVSGLCPFSFLLEVSIQLSTSLWQSQDLCSAVIPLCPFTAAGEAACYVGWLGAAQQRCQVPNYYLCKTHPNLGLLKLPLIFINPVGTPRILKVCSSVSFGWEWLQKFLPDKRQHHSICVFTATP